MKQSYLIYYSLDIQSVTHGVFLNDFIGNNLALHYVNPGNNLLFQGNLGSHMVKTASHVTGIMKCEKFCFVLVIKTKQNTYGPLIE